MTCHTSSDDVVEQRFEAFHTYQKWMEGCAGTYLRQKYQGVDGYPAAFERWYYDAPKLILVPSELASDEMTKSQTKGISKSINALRAPQMWKQFVDNRGDMSVMAEIADEVGLKPKHIPMIVALAALAISSGGVKQAKSCGAECPYSHALGCLIGGQCTKQAGHIGMHSDGRGHSWG